MAVSAGGMSMNQLTEYQLLMYRITTNGAVADAETVKRFKAGKLDDGITLEKRGGKYFVNDVAAPVQLVELYKNLFDKLVIVDVTGKEYTTAEDIFAAIDSGDVDAAVSNFVLQLPPELYAERQKLGKPKREESTSI